VWDAMTGEPLSPPLVHRNKVRSVAFSPNGSWVVSASSDRTARIWNATTGKSQSRPLTHRGSVSCAVFSPDGKLVGTASWDESARVWDAGRGQPVSPPLAHRGPVVTIAFSPDGSRVVTASWDHTVRVWDARTGEPLAPAVDHEAHVMGAAFSPDGTLVVSASSDRTACIWDPWIERSRRSRSRRLRRLTGFELELVLAGGERLTQDAVPMLELGSVDQVSADERLGAVTRWLQGGGALDELMRDLGVMAADGIRLLQTGAGSRATNRLVPRRDVGISAELAEELQRLGAVGGPPEALQDELAEAEVVHFSGVGHPSDNDE
jgi:hypothetical protein